MSPCESMITPLPSSPVPEAPPLDWTTTNAASTARYAGTAAGGWDCSCETAVLAWLREMALTCVLVRSGRPEIRRLVTMRAAERPRTARRSTARATATRRDTPAPARPGSGRADVVGFGVGR